MRNERTQTTISLRSCAMCMSHVVVVMVQHDTNFAHHFYFDPFSCFHIVVNPKFYIFLYFFLFSCSLIPRLNITKQNHQIRRCEINVEQLFVYVAKIRQYRRIICNRTRIDFCMEKSKSAQWLINGWCEYRHGRNRQLRFNSTKSYANVFDISVQNVVIDWKLLKAPKINFTKSIWQEK